MVQHCDKVTTENALTTAVSLHCFPNGLRTRPVLTGGPESPDSLRRRLDPWGDDRSKLASGSQLFNGALQHKYIRLKLELTLR